MLWGGAHFIPTSSTLLTASFLSALFPWRSPSYIKVLCSVSWRVQCLSLWPNLKGNGKLQPSWLQRKTFFWCSARRPLGNMEHWLWGTQTASLVGAYIPGMVCSREVWTKSKVNFLKKLHPWDYDKLWEAFLVLALAFLGADQTSVTFLLSLWDREMTRTLFFALSKKGEVLPVVLWVPVPASLDSTLTLSNIDFYTVHILLNIL